MAAFSESSDSFDAQHIRELYEVVRNNSISGTSVRGISGACAWTEEIDPRQDTAKWVDENRNITPIAELETEHIKRILDGFNMENNWGGQSHKKDILVAEYKKRKNDK